LIAGKILPIGKKVIIFTNAQRLRMARTGPAQNWTRVIMITYEITGRAILSILAGCTAEITMHELFDLVPEHGRASDSPVTFIKTLNELLDRELVHTSQNSEGMIRWTISKTGRESLLDYTI
jgi:hypothetical protein